MANAGFMQFTVDIKPAGYDMVEAVVTVRYPPLTDDGKTPPSIIKDPRYSAQAMDPLEATRRAFQMVFERIAQEHER